MLEKLFGKTNVFGIKGTVSYVLLVLFLFFNKLINTVKRYTAVVTDNSTPAVSIGKTGYNVATAGKSHFFGIRPENTVIMRGAKLEFILNLIAKAVAVGGASLTRHSDTAKWVNTAL